MQKLMRNSCLLMAALVAGATLYETVNLSRPWLIVSGIAIFLLNILMYTLWDDMEHWGKVRDDEPA